jgi:hypothetical protein
MTQCYPLPSIEIVEALFEYNPLTGELTPVKPRKNWTDSPKSGYQTVRIEGRRYNISRICWLLGTKQDPGDLEIDHIDRDPYNNALSNLRLATRSQQLSNRRRTSSSQLPKGVTFNKRRNTYGATWGENGRKRNLSGFDTAEEAHLFYLWNTRHHGEFADPLPISACPPRPAQKNVNRKRRGTEDLPKGVSYVRRRGADGSLQIRGYQASFTNKEGKKQSKKFKTAEEAHKFYLENRKHNVA